MLISNLDMEFHNGWTAALEEVYQRLTGGDGRTESYEDALTFIRRELGY